MGNYYDEWNALAVLDGNTIISTPAESTRSIITQKYDLNGTTLTLTNDNDKFDFSLMGQTSVPASSVIVLQKQ